MMHQRTLHPISLSRVEFVESDNSVSRRVTPIGSTHTYHNAVIMMLQSVTQGDTAIYHDDALFEVLDEDGNHIADVVIHCNGLVTVHRPQ